MCASKKADNILGFSRTVSLEFAGFPSVFQACTAFQSFAGTFASNVDLSQSKRPQFSAFCVFQVDFLADLLSQALARLQIQFPMTFCLSLLPKSTKPHKTHRLSFDSLNTFYGFLFGRRSQSYCTKIRSNCRLQTNSGYSIGCR